MCLWSSGSSCWDHVLEWVVETCIVRIGAGTDTNAQKSCIGPWLWHHTETQNKPTFREHTRQPCFGVDALRSILFRLLLRTDQPWWTNQCNDRKLTTPCLHLLAIVFPRYLYRKDLGSKASCAKPSVGHTPWAAQRIDQDIKSAMRSWISSWTSAMARRRSGLVYQGIHWAWGSHDMIGQPGNLTWLHSFVRDDHQWKFDIHHLGCKLVARVVPPMIQRQPNNDQGWYIFDTH